MLRKGLPRAFPGLEEVKGESVKEGTQYRSRVFIATPELVQGVCVGGGMGGCVGVGVCGCVCVCVWGGECVSTCVGVF